MKLKALPLVFTLSFSTLFLGTAVTYAKDYEDHKMNYGIKKALSRNIVSLDHKGNFYPNSNTTRAEFASMVTHALNLNIESTIKFKDVPTSHKYYSDIQKAYQTGLISGYNSSEFKPDLAITREEMVLMMYRYIKNSEVILPTSNQEPFTDKNKLRYPQIVQASKNLGIVSGYGDNSFKGDKTISKAEAVAVLIRVVERVENKLIEDSQEKSVDNIDDSNQQSDNQITQPTAPSNYKVSTKTGNDNFSSYADAYSNFSSKSEPAILYLGDKIVDANVGLAKTKNFTLVYKDGQNSSYSYLATGSEVRYEESIDDKLYFKVGGEKLYVFKKDVEVINIGQNTSYYQNQNGKLYHKVFNNNTYSSYHAGNAPSFMVEGVSYRSFEGNIFDGKEVYQYFNYLPLRTPSSYSASDLDKYIKTYSPDSPLNGYGKVFIEAAKKNNLNPMYLLANAIHESGWGKSKIAREKNNLFGFKAYDASAYDSAASFETLAEGIYYCAEYISARYLTPGTWYYNSGILGNKGVGMNVKYASDPFWGQKIAGHMYRMDELLGNKDNNKYLIGTLQSGTTLYVIENGELKAVDKTKSSQVVAKKKNFQTSNGLLIELYSEYESYSNLYVLPNDFKEIKTY